MPQNAHSLKLCVLPDLFAICRLGPDAGIPVWATSGSFTSATWTSEELSIVCAEAVVPDGVRCERSWRCLRVEGSMDLSMIGVLASLVAPLAAAGISVFAVSTFDTDYLLVKEKDLVAGVAALRQRGHDIAGLVVNALGGRDSGRAPR